MQKPPLSIVPILLLLAMSIQTSPGLAAPGDLDYDVPGGHFFTQTNGQPLGASPTGYSVTNDGDVPFWDAFQQLGGPYVLGYPVTRRFTYDGFVTQAMQKVVFQWRPDVRQVWFLNTFDALHDTGKDGWLLTYRQTPAPFDTSADSGRSWQSVVDRHLGFLDQNQPIKALYFADPQPIDHFGLPVAYADEGNSFVIRAQRATFQYWKEDVPWAQAGAVTVANGGDLAKEAGLWPSASVSPENPARAGTERTSLQLPAAGSSSYRAAGPEFGLSVFLWGHPERTSLDLQKVSNAGAAWQKTLFQWRQIEGAGKGQFDWTEPDRIVKASNDAGIKIIARVDFEPYWARADQAWNGPPDNLEDYGDFMFALVDRYKAESPYGRIRAVEIWNEPNLSREWGNQKPDAWQYVQLLKAGYIGAKQADPSVTVISAGLTPTGTWSDEATPDDLFLQQMYDAGARDYFDVLGAHGAGYKAPPEMSPDQVAADPGYGGGRFFCFRRVEDLRNVMVRNGDGSKQIWLLEFGWTSDNVHPEYSWYAVTEDLKAQYLVRSFQWARNNWASWIGVMAVWNMPDPSWTPDREEYWWAIANPDGTSRPAYDLLRQSH